jgi:hypothetical protein
LVRHARADWEKLWGVGRRLMFVRLIERGNLGFSFSVVLEVWLYHIWIFNVT